MKKLLVLLMAMLMLFSLCACGDEGENKKDDPSGSSSLDEETMNAKECLSKLLNSDDAEELEKLVTTPSEEYFENVNNAYPDNDYKIKAKKIGSHDGLDVYHFEVNKKSDSSFSVKGIELFRETEDGMIIENSQDVINEFLEDCTCSDCGGSGSVVSGGTPCAICAGTCVQYFPNTYFDPATNMWMGETRACSGCAGAGTVGAISRTCGNCDGYGVEF